MPLRPEDLSAAERLVKTLLSCTDHIVHNRPGMICTDANNPIGFAWQPVVQREESFGSGVSKIKAKMIYKPGAHAVGWLEANGEVRNNIRYHRNQPGKIQPHQQPSEVIGWFRPAGFYPEAAAWLYRQVAEVWKLDNELAARWASWAFPKEHRDMKVILAALMLVQSRCGAPVKEGGVTLFMDDDYRDIGAAMCLLRRKDGNDLNPRLILRVGELLELPAVAQVNRELGFSKSARNSALGRWPKVVEAWLRHRENNPGLLESAVKAGFRQTIMRLARKVGYKPQSEEFFRILQWKQAQAEDGRRTVGLDLVLAKDLWADLGEVEICEKIMAEKPDFKRMIGQIPKKIGLTRAILAAAMQAGCISDKELIILTPTLEDLGLLELDFIQERWKKAVDAAKDQRAAHIATRVRSKETAEKLVVASEKAAQAAVARSVESLRIYVFVDISGSMEGAIEKAKVYLAKLLVIFPLTKVHVCVFNTAAREVTIRHPSAAGVTHAFSAFRAGGGTDYGAGVRFLAKYKPAANEESFFIFVGDQQAGWFTEAVKQSNLKPVAFGFVPVGDTTVANAVTGTAYDLKIPCFNIEEQHFADAYALPRTITHLLEAAPATTLAASEAPLRTPLIDQILQTELLTLPTWAQ